MVSYIPMVRLSSGAVVLYHPQTNERSTRSSIVEWSRSFARALESRGSGCYSIRMTATTLKVEGELLKELERAKPQSQHLPALVRTGLQQDVMRQQPTE